MGITFDQLRWAMRICHDTHPYFIHIIDWAQKRDHIGLYQQDIPTLIANFKERQITPHPTNPRARIEDPIPGLRLATACESLAHCVYSMADIAAGIANKASKGALPASFNQICKRASKGQLPASLLAQAADLTWYARVREIRTEWSHHSSVFIGRDGDEPVLVVRCYRREADRALFKNNLQVRPAELVKWSVSATLALDNFGSAVFYEYLAATYPMDLILNCPERDSLGFPLQHPDGRFVAKKISVKDYLAEAGIEPALHG